MAKESMSSDERLWSAIRLEKPDRVPVIPTLLPEPVERALKKMTEEIIAKQLPVIKETDINLWLLLNPI